MAKNKFGKIRQILLDHWDGYRKEHPELRHVVIENVLKVMTCRTELLGYHLYVCKSCGEGHVVPHSCKSRFCSVCGYVATDNWILERFPRLLNCWYSHVVVTVPAYFRWMIKQDRNVTLKLMLRCARQTIRAWCKKRGYEPATISFFHSFGEKLQFHPHFHILVTAGGLRPNGEWYYTDGAMPPHILMPIFKAKFIAGMKALFKDGTLTTKSPLSRVFYQMNKQHDTHWQFYVARVTKRSAETMRYCVRYAKKMIISEKRILHYDGKIVIIKTKTAHITYPVEQFLKLILQHIPEKQFRLIGYDGFYANKSEAKYKNAAKYWEPLVQTQGKTTWRDRQWARNKQDPLTCKRCKREFTLETVRYGKKWVYFKMDDIYRANGIVKPVQLALDSS